MVCKIPDNDFCYFKGPCKYQNGSMTTNLNGYTELYGSNVCFNLFANYKPGQVEVGGQIPFTIFGTITPQKIQVDTYRPLITFNVTGTRIRGVNTFNASGTIGKHTAEPFRIDWKAKPSSDIVDITVFLPSKALLANRVAR